MCSLPKVLFWKLKFSRADWMESTMTMPFTAYVSHTSFSLFSECQSKLTKDCRRQLSVRALNLVATTFFAGGLRPTGIPYSPRLVEIAQRLPASPTGTTYFVTLFNPNRNIPLYSAYKVTPTQAAGIGTNQRQKFKWRNPKDANGQGMLTFVTYKYRPMVVSGGSNYPFQNKIYDPTGTYFVGECHNYTQVQLKKLFLALET